MPVFFHSTAPFLEVKRRESQKRPNTIRGNDLLPNTLEERGVFRDPSITSLRSNALSWCGYDCFRDFLVWLKLATEVIRVTGQYGNGNVADSRSRLEYQSRRV